MGRVPCIGCGGLVPDVEGPSHRYMLASPGCWAAYTQTLSGGNGGSWVQPHGALTVDAYAVQHPGVPNPQATQSVWVHLITLHLALEGGWPVEQLVRIRRFGADSSAGWPWLEPPASMAPVTAIDVVEAGRHESRELVRGWVEGAWAAWAEHHSEVCDEAARLVAKLG
jgi:hypothetical protein